MSCIPPGGGLSGPAGRGAVVRRAVRALVCGARLRLGDVAAVGLLRGGGLGFALEERRLLLLRRLEPRQLLLQLLLVRLGEQDRVGLSV